MEGAFEPKTVVANSAYKAYAITDAATAVAARAVEAALFQAHT